MSPSLANDFLPEVITSEVLAECRREFLEVMSRTGSFCLAVLTGEWQKLCPKVAAAIFKAASNIKPGKRESWACGTVSSVG